MGPSIFDYYKRLILLSVILLSGGHCTIQNTGFRTRGDMIIFELILNTYAFPEKLSPDFSVSKEPSKNWLKIWGTCV